MISGTLYNFLTVVTCMKYRCKIKCFTTKKKKKKSKKKSLEYSSKVRAYIDPPTCQVSLIKWRAGEKGTKRRTMGALGTWWGLDGSCLLGKERGSRSMCTRRQCYVVVAARRPLVPCVCVCLPGKPVTKNVNTKNVHVHHRTWKYVCSTFSVSARVANRAEGK